MLQLLRYLFILPLFGSFVLLNTYGQTVKIMPMGNSITYDDKSGDVRPVGDRIAYRYKLYQLLTAAGYTFDFTGSENTGNNFFQNTEFDDHAGFPGINDAQLAHLINTGYNQRNSVQEAPGPYLNYYAADIILLHIGTNDLDENPDDVEDILNNIRFYDSDVIILLARIINRKTYSAATTAFNNNVEAMVNARVDNRIVVVDMENGAGINYSTEMADLLHPTQAGYDKMAAKWFEALQGLNNKPVVTTIPEQTTPRGSAFPILNLDPFVSDDEDPDFLINWTFRSQPGSELDISIDGSRNLLVSPVDNDWFGSETIVLKAEDSGNGAFKESDSVSVVFTVTKGNDPPVITSTPEITVNEDINYSYMVTATDIDEDILIYSAIAKPAWLTFNTETHTLGGKPGNNEVGSHAVTLRVFDGSLFADQSFYIEVINVNDLPVIGTEPDTVVSIGGAYLYELSATDIDAGDMLSYTCFLKPAWLSFSASSANGLLYGTPLAVHLGTHAIILKVNDGHTDVIQAFSILVRNPTHVEDISTRNLLLVYSNPAGNTIFLKLAEPGNMHFQLFDLTGTLRFSIDSILQEIVEIDMSGLPKGLYVYRALIGNDLVTGKITKI